MTLSLPEHEQFEIPDEITKEIKRLIRRQIRSGVDSEAEKVHKLNLEIIDLKDKLHKSERAIEALENSLDWKENDRKQICEEAKSLEKWIDKVLDSKPAGGWHCSDVDNWKQRSDFFIKFQHYAKIQNPSVIGSQLELLDRLIRRFERETETTKFELDDLKSKYKALNIEFQNYVQKSNTSSSHSRPPTHVLKFPRLEVSA